MDDLELLQLIFAWYQQHPSLNVTHFAFSNGMGGSSMYARIRQLELQGYLAPDKTLTKKGLALLISEQSGIADTAAYRYFIEVAS